MSNLLVQSGPAVEPVTLAEMKAHLRLDGAEEDAVVSACIVAARQACESYTGRSLISQTWQLYLDRWPKGAMRLPRGPVQELLSVAVIGDDGDATLLDGDGFHLDASADPPRLLRKRGAFWTTTARSLAGIEITYKAGYGDSWNDVPQALRQGLMMAAAQFYEHREGGGDAHLPPAIAALWNPYRSLRL